MTASWTFAARYVTDRQLGGEIRMYWLPALTGKGSGLILDPKFGGPKNSSLGRTNPELSIIQLAADIDDQEFAIGPPAGFTYFSQSAEFRQDVFCSDTTYVIEGLDSWQDSASVKGAFSTERVLPFRNIPTYVSGGKGLGFFIRTGIASLPSTLHYARVFVKPDKDGKLIRIDEDGEKYIVLEIAYQTAPGVPYV